MNKIIFLNGCGSSGKTSIARSIQHLSNESWLTFGIDTFISMTPFPCKDKGDAGYFSFIPGKNDRGPMMRVETGPKGDQLFGLMPDFENLLATRGNNLIIDEVLFGDIYLKSYIKTLQNHIVYFVGVFCELPVMQEREILRRDRSIGLSNDQVDRIHKGLRQYDLIVDTTNASPFEVSKQILAFLDEHPAPQGFLTMRKELQS